MLIEGTPNYSDPAPDYVIILPFVYGRLNECTLKWASDTDHPVHTIELDAYNPYAYGQMLQSLWDRHGHLIVVEQDVVPPGDAVDRLLECNSFWCSFPYQVNGIVWGEVLGCTRFSAQLQDGYPHLMWRAASNLGGSLRLAHWRQLNGAINEQLHMHGIPLHQHHPEAIHLRDERVSRYA